MERHIIQGWGPAALLMLALGSSACAASVKSASSQAAEGAVPAGTHSALSTLEDPNTRTRMVSVVETPEVQRAINELSSAATQGVVEGLSSDQMKSRIDELVKTLTNAVVVAMTDGTNAVVDQAFSARRQQAVERFAATVTASMMRSAAGEIPESMGPALRKAMVEQIGPGLVATLRSDEFKQALGEISQDAARNATIGANNGLAELDERRKHDGGGMPLGVVGAFFRTRTWLLALLIAAIVFTIPILWLLRERRATRRLQEESKLRTERATAILGALEASRDQGWSSDLIALVRRQLLGDAIEAPRSRPAHPA